MANSVAHFAVYADDLDRAMTFYSTVFGWTFQPWGPPDFYLISTGESEGVGLVEGALSKRHGPVAEGLNAYRCTISVADVESMMKTIEDNGGKLRSPLADIPGIGKVVEFEDTESNVVCAMQYADGFPSSV